MGEEYLRASPCVEVGELMSANLPQEVICIMRRLLQNALLCFDRALLSNVEGLSMNGRNYNDFKMVTVRPEPFDKLRRAR